MTRKRFINLMRAISTEPEFYTIGSVPEPTEPMGSNMQRIAEKLEGLNLDWLEDN